MKKLFCIVFLASSFLVTPSFSDEKTTKNNFTLNQSFQERMDSKKVKTEIIKAPKNDEAKKPPLAMTPLNDLDNPRKVKTIKIIPKKI